MANAKANIAADVESNPSFDADAPRVAGFFIVSTSLGNSRRPGKDDLGRSLAKGFHTASLLALRAVGWCRVGRFAAPRGAIKLG